MQLETGTSRYVVVPAASTLKFDVSTSLHPVHGQASDLHGTIEVSFDGDTLAHDPAPHMHVEFPVNSLRSGNTLQDREVWKLVDSRRFPMVAGDLRALRPNGKTYHYFAAGDITLAGRQRRYDGELTVTREGERLTVEGELTFDVRHFGLKPPQMLMFKVDPHIKVHLRVVAEREG